MAFNVQAIKYGWVALVSLGVITGATIYVTNNQRHQVKPQDIIEIALGTYERCLATQTSTNPVSYYVSPPSFVRTWYSNVYTTNGVTVYTNIVTNAIGWHIDRAMMISLDTTIKTLVPYYVDTNTVYDGTTNIVMLTVTGLWASLGIGDRTNKFTREPCWTNSVSTNWIVNYTSYWPSTNGTMTNIIYTSDYRQVVSYAQSWTATGGHVWVTSSNWASEVVTVTNATTYGDYPWQIYVEDLQERYKVLNELKCVKIPSAFDVEYSHREVDSFYSDLQPYRKWNSAVWDGVQGTCEYVSSLIVSNGDSILTNSAHGRQNAGEDGWWNPEGFYVGIQIGYEAEKVGSSTNGADYIAGMVTGRLKVTGPRLWGTNLAIIKSFCQQYIREASIVGIIDFGVYHPTETNVFHSYYSSDEIYTNAAQRTIKQWPSNHVFLIDFPSPEWSTAPTTQYRHFYGSRYKFYNADSYLFPQFNYCTNKYW